MYDDYVSSFETLLDKPNSVTIYNKNLRLLVTDIFELGKNLSPTLKCKVVKELSYYNIAENESGQTVIKEKIMYVSK